MSKPIVTAIIDTYNHERFIEEAVMSVLGQDFPRADTEILVIDDGSTDRTPEILRKFEPHVRVLRKENGGQASAFNASIPEAQGEFIALLDGDDWWPTNKLSRVMETFSREPELGAVGHGESVVYSDGRQLLHVLHESHRFRANNLSGARLYRLFKSCFGTSRTTAKKDLLLRVLPVPEALTVEADEYLSAMFSVLSDVRVLPEALVYYRLHDANGFQLQINDPSRTRRKQMVLHALAGELRKDLRELNVDNDVIHAIVDIVQAEADQVRLALGDGWSWETVRTEWTTYDVMCADASPAHRWFKKASLALALAVPPKDYYDFRRWLSTSDFYLTLRAHLLPMPEPRHVLKSWRQ
jgi:glycosyltransferase involved in cell wall biosynthesis